MMEKLKHYLEARKKDLINARAESIKKSERKTDPHAKMLYESISNLFYSRIHELDLLEQFLNKNSENE